MVTDHKTWFGGGVRVGFEYIVVCTVRSQYLSIEHTILLLVIFKVLSYICMYDKYTYIDKYILVYISMCVCVCIWPCMYNVIRVLLKSIRVYIYIFTYLYWS